MISLNIYAWLLLAFNLCAILFSLVDTATVFSLKTGQKGKPCQPVKRSVLMNRMGSSFNNRYMATDHSQVLSDTADHTSRNNTARSQRSKRGQKIDVSMISSPAPWTCQTTDNWKDLGAVFFPRFIRSVTCSTSTCWYGHFVCRPKIFQIKVLKRKTGVCTKVYSAQGQPRFEDYWKMTNQNVAIYCECGH